MNIIANISGKPNDQPYSPTCLLKNVYISVTFVALLEQNIGTNSSVSFSSYCFLKLIKSDPYTREESWSERSKSQVIQKYAPALPGVTIHRVLFLYPFSQCMHESTILDL
jgi:hypothetical protein